MLVKVFGAAVQGIDALVVTIEVNCSQGIRFFMVGLPDAAVKESHERIVSAVEHNGYRFPRKQVIVNMSPADIRKEGAAYDLPLAVGILASDEKIETGKLSEYMLMGELSLDGSILPIKGALPIAIKAREEGFKGFFEKEVPSNPLKAEYLIPIFIGELLEQGKMSVKVLKTNDTWYGMTYHEDVAAVKDSFKKMLENGVYKADLFSDL